MFKYKKEVAPTEDCKLPKNRKELLKIIFKEDFSLIARISLTNFIFDLPFIGALITLVLLLSTSSSLEYNELFSLVFYFSLIFIPCIILSRIFRGGTYNILKCRTYNEGYLFSRELFSSVKENFKRSILNGLILAVSLFIFLVGSTYLYIFLKDSIYTWVGITALALAFIIILNTSEFMLINDNIYEMRFVDSLKNSFSFSCMMFIISLIFGIVTFIVPIILIFIFPISIFIIVFINMIYVSGFIEALYQIYAEYLFDKYINAENYPNELRKGLYKEN